MALSIRDILILDYFDGKPVHHKIPPYKLKIYGQDANDRIGILYENGWIRYSRPQETVSMLPDKALSDFLKRYGLSGEGSHAELTGRVISQIPESDYAHGVPKIYVLTKEGKAEIGHHMAYVLNVRENYGLTEGEIGESQNTLAQRGEPYTARDILYRAFQQKISLYIMAGEWSKLRNMYYTVANFYLRIKDNEEALPYLYLVFFMDMSGMGNKNNLVPYENLFPTQKGMILLMDEIRKDLHYSMDEVKTSFLSSIARMAPRLPFSYFFAAGHGLHAPRTPPRHRLQWSQVHRSEKYPGSLRQVVPLRTVRKKRSQAQILPPARRETKLHGPAGLKDAHLHRAPALQAGPVRPAAKPRARAREERRACFKKKTRKEKGHLLQAERSVLVVLEKDTIIL